MFSFGGSKDKSKGKGKERDRPSHTRGSSHSPMYRQAEMGNSGAHMKGVPVGPSLAPSRSYQGPEPMRMPTPNVTPNAHSDTEDRPRAFPFPQVNTASRPHRTHRHHQSHTQTHHTERHRHRRTYSQPAVYYGQPQPYVQPQIQFSQSMQQFSGAYPQQYPAGQAFTVLPGYNASHAPAAHLRRPDDRDRYDDRRVGHGGAQGYSIPPPEPSREMFQYSRCTGRKKALCIGINYFGEPHELRGCINDARNVHEFLIKNHHYHPEDMVLLTDDQRDPRRRPTRRNIIDAMRWLVQGAQRHDALFFHYSGHGGQTPDLDGDETDGLDEVIFPLDFQKKSHIVDDEMHEIMVHTLPIGCRLTAIFDSCHSGTALDLPYIYHSNGRLKGEHVSARARRMKATPADIISFSGCKDDGTSADTFSEGEAVGAMSDAFMKVLRNRPVLSYRDLLRDIRERMKKNNLIQKPQLSSSHRIDTNLRFIC